jgi:ABC-type branched-subunit amino acid transport system substrate-binding protein
MTAPTRGGGDVNSPMNLEGDSTTASSPREEQDYRDITTLYSRGAFEAAILKLQAFAKNYPRSPLRVQTANLHGLCDLLSKRPAQAIPHFQRAIDRAGAASPLTPYLLYNLANAQFEAGRLDESQRTAARIVGAADMDRDNRIKVHYLKGRILARKGLPAESARECLIAGKAMLPTASRDTRNAVSTLLDSQLRQLQDTAVLEDLYRNFEDSSLADQPLFRLGALEIGSPATQSTGRMRLQLLHSRFPDSVYATQAAELLRAHPEPGSVVAGSELTPSDLTTTASNASNRDTGPVEPMTIGVLLPMKGKFAKFGARTLQGIELAFRIFNESEPDSKVTLVIEDSGEEAESTIRALERLVLRHHVVGVIGPLLSKGIDQVTARAEALGIPMISLARHVGSPGEYVFQGGLTLRIQTTEIARYAVEKLGIKRFAIVYPRDKVGEDGMHRFWDAVESLGGTVAGVESYNPGETDFRQPIDRLSGLYYTEARARELEELSKQRTLNNIKKRTRRTEQYFSLKPIIDYEAVFIPEEAKIAGQILPTFAYRDVDQVKFLGTSAWNNSELATRTQAAAERAFFPDAFFPEDGSPQTRKYVDKYRATYNQEPTAMDALAYDAARVLESILARDPSIGRSELKDKLREVRRFPGVTGTLSCQDNYFMRDLKILTANRQGKVIPAAN